MTFEGEYFNGKKWNGTLETTDDNNKLYELKNGNGHFIELELILGYYFEGEYINGSKNGKGKEYRFGKLFYEGQYLNDLKNGKGKEYDQDGHLIFEGIYLYNHRLSGKEYYADGKIKYEGEYLFDLQWTGKAYDENGNIIYEIKNGAGYIEYLNGKKMVKEKNIIKVN